MITDKELTSIDLFSGAGGITEGLSQAGFGCLYANDFDEWAVATFSLNHPQAVSDPRPIESVDARKLRKRLGLARGELDTMVGGPPCQGFSINAPERLLSDPRNKLFSHFCRFVGEFEPKTFLFENVPGLVSLERGRVLSLILREFQKLGYSTRARILFAANYGVPQERWRLIILGARAPEGPHHPLPTHYAKGRANFTGGRTLTLMPLELQRDALVPPVTVADAIGDLPLLELGEGGEELEYTRPPHSSYARVMRSGSDRVYNHFAGKLSPQNVARMAHVRPGGSWRDIPFELLPKGMQRARRSDHTKRYGRLSGGALAGTVMTKCDPHWGAVFLPDQHRALTVREAARLQSFPDRFRFLGSRVEQYKQVGNAVPVLMARAIGAAIAEFLADSSVRRAS